MVDRLTAQERSAFMARIRSRDTRPELVVRRLLHETGYRYHLHHKPLAGRPDLAFTKRRKAVFVHGCFWHGHEGCALAHIPKTRSDYWREKFERNRARDARNLAKLDADGWDALVVWECEVADPPALAARLMAFLGLPRWSRSVEPGAKASDDSRSPRRQSGA